MRNFLAITGAALTIVALIPYIVDIVKKNTKPNIVSWFTWTLLTSIATAAAFAAHENYTAWLTLANAIGTLSIVLLGFKYGIAKFSIFDGLCQIGALIALAAWLIFNSPVLAIIGVVLVDFLGVLPTIRHSWLKPGEETWQTFFLSTIAPIFTIFSLTKISLESFLYPFYLLLADSLVMLIILYRRRELGISLSRHGVHETLHE